MSEWVSVYVHACVLACVRVCVSACVREWVRPVNTLFTLLPTYSLSELKLPFSKILLAFHDLALQKGQNLDPFLQAFLSSTVEPTKRKPLPKYVNIWIYEINNVQIQDVTTAKWLLLVFVNGALRFVSNISLIIFLTIPIYSPPVWQWKWYRWSPNLIY